ncbi:MAG: glycosyltransferase [Alkalicoccus sp.]|nr:MAG: glycosyltransferase [Alkalicoccus sp.]
MKITFLSPHYDEWRGNKITVDRIANNIRSAGYNTEIISSTGPFKEPMEGTELLHGFHAYKFALYYRKLQAPLPYIITVTGTDMNHDIFQEEKRPVIIECLKSSAFIHVFDTGMKEKVAEEVPDCHDKICVIPQSIKPLPFRPAPVLNSRYDKAVLFLPAGIRHVKNIRRAVMLTEKLRGEFPNVELVVAGPVIEKEEGDWLNKQVHTSSWLTYAGERPFHEMLDLYRNSSIVINSSRSEGQSSAVMEAMSAGTPVIASNIRGNRSLITHEYTGCLFESDEEFYYYARKLLLESSFRENISRRAADYIRKCHDVQTEREKLAEIYAKAVKT